MSLEIQGKLHEVFATQQITEKFKKREFIVDMDDNGYQQYIKFQLNQDKCTLIDSFKKGEEIKVSFNLSGRAFTSKTGDQGYITNIIAWKIQSLGNAANTSNENSNSNESIAEGNPFASGEPAGDLPF